MREALRTMPVDERRTEWTRFLHGRDGYMTQIAELFRNNVDGAHELYNRLRGAGVARLLLGHLDLLPMLGHLPKVLQPQGPERVFP